MYEKYIRDEDGNSEEIANRLIVITFHSDNEIDNISLFTMSSRRSFQTYKSKY